MEDCQIRVYIHESIELAEFFRGVESDIQKKIRASHISAPVRNQVLMDSHGRCMFEGCGVDLTIDPVTGDRGGLSLLSRSLSVQIPNVGEFYICRMA